MASRPYHEQVDINNTLKLRELTASLPSFTILFFRGIEPTTSSRTRIAYAYDLHVFFEYLKENHSDFMGMDIRSLPVESLDRVRAVDLEAYTEYLKYYTSREDGTERMNHNRGIMRKISALKTMYNYFFRKEMIKTNPANELSLKMICEYEHKTASMNPAIS